MTAPKTAPEATELGENVSVTREGDKLTITVDLAYRNDVGKPDTIRVATTRGNQQIAGTDVRLGINAYVYRTPK